MKKLKYILPILFFSVFVACEEEGRIDFIDSSGKAPIQITNITITPTAGGGVVHYNIPDDSNFLYAKAVYEAPSGVVREASASKYTNSLVLEGFGDENEHEIKLISVGNNNKESSPVLEKITPLKAALHRVAESVEMKTAFGGIEVLFTNILKADIVVEIVISTDTGWKSVDKLYTNEVDGRFVARGLAPIESKFGVIIHDPFGNSSAIREATFAPLFEVQIPTNEFKNLALPNDSKSLRSNNPITHLWDGVTTSQGNFWASDQGGDPFPKWISLDFGEEYLISRIRKFERRGYEYSSWIPNKWEVYGSNNPNSDGSWESWTLLHEFGKPFKPSGLPTGERTAEDEAYAREGHNYELINIPTQAYRYYRIKWLETDNTQEMVLISEMMFWGQPLN